MSALMAATRRPVAGQAPAAGLDGEPAWRTLPGWFVRGDADRNIPAAALRFMAERARVLSRGNSLALGTR
ncbi:hypothetical protein [Actinoplanes sp. NPDC020271]|uniref:hypothetical protein n=1 Tax=Actinoplanes sp. NPDC020271 TaxID=3363896 RepID=UPI0037BDB871